MAREYRCAHCGETFTKPEGREPEAQAEAIRLWGRPGNHPEMVEICEDCFQQFMKWYEGESRRP
jgi:hypothetical protein